MATSATPYGLKPMNLIGGQSYAGSTREIKIASGYAVNIYTGSIVSIVAAGKFLWIPHRTVCTQAQKEH